MIAKWRHLIGRSSNMYPGDLLKLNNTAIRGLGHYNNAEFYAANKRRGVRMASLMREYRPVKASSLPLEILAGL